MTPTAIQPASSGKPYGAPRAGCGTPARTPVGLDGYTWYSHRHTFASRLAMAGVDARTIQVPGGWKTLAMVARYSHLSAAHLQAAVERIVTPAEPENSWKTQDRTTAARPAGVS